MKLFVHLGLVLAALSSCLGNSYVENPMKAPDAGHLFRIKRGGKWGFMDRTGKTTIRPQFESVGDFFSGLARFTSKETCGYIDETGKTVIPARFQNCGNFREGLAPVRSGRAWGYLRTDGTFAIEPKFQGAGEFREGLARVEVWDHIRCITAEHLSSTGGIEFDRDKAPDDAFELHRGYYLTEEPCDVGAQGFIDHEGRIVVALRPGPMGDFSDGRAWFRETEASGASRWGFLNTSGEIAIQPHFAYPPRDFQGGLLVFDAGGDTHLNGAMNRDGNVVIQPRFKRLGYFWEGLAEACEEYYSCGYVDTSGQWVIPPQFESGGVFRDGIARVWSPLLRPQYIDRSGKTVLLLGKDEFAPWPFVDGLTVVEDVKSSRYVDRNGKTVAIYDDTPKRR